MRNYKIYGKDQTQLLLNPRSEFNFSYSGYEIREYRELSYNGRNCFYIYRWAIMNGKERVALLEREDSVNKFFHNPIVNKKFIETTMSR